VIFAETPLRGAFVIETEPLEDARGLFARTWCQREFEAHGLEIRIAQCSTSYNKKKGTLRGLHHQAPPFEETKIVRCTRGSIYDVIVDLRAESPTFTRFFAAVLSADNRKAMYVPAGSARWAQSERRLGTWLGASASLIFSVNLLTSLPSASLIE
jgi:dTDP-4-dehydrorhamnose 3,5-epimerase